jgi:hypothetical protein
MQAIPYANVAVPPGLSNLVGALLIPLSPSKTSTQEFEPDFAAIETVARSRDLVPPLTTVTSNLFGI